jgi:hypothetical protein
MNKLFLALIVGVLALGSAPLLADDLDTKPLSKMTTEEAKVARATAKAKWDAMTPEEKAAVKKAIAKKRPAELTALEAVAADEGPVYSRRCAAYYNGPALTTSNCTPLIGDFDQTPRRGPPPTKAPSKTPGTTPQEQPAK